MWVSQNGQTPSIIGICSYCVLDRPVFERCQTLLHPELTPWWSFLLTDGAHHKKPHSPTHPIFGTKLLLIPMLTNCQLDPHPLNEQTTVKFESNIRNFIQQNAFENVICKRWTFCSGPKCEKTELLTTVHCQQSHGIICNITDYLFMEIANYSIMVPHGMIPVRDQNTRHTTAA